LTHLRRYLEQQGALPPEHLDAAVRRQQIYGGSLDTVLLELELVDPHTLGELLVQACGLPLAPFGLIDDERDRPWQELPADVLDIGWAVPLVRHGDMVWIAVHPDLPNERLGALYRLVPNVNPFVIPECALEKIAAERTASVVPQRYAVLCVAYLSALRRRPSVSDVGFPMLHEMTSGSMPLSDLVPASPRAMMLDDESAPIDEPLPEPPIEDEFERRTTIVFDPPRTATLIPTTPPAPIAPIAPSLGDADVPGDSHLTLRVDAARVASIAADGTSRPPSAPQPVADVRPPSAPQPVADVRPPSAPQPAARPPSGPHASATSDDTAPRGSDPPLDERRTMIPTGGPRPAPIAFVPPPLPERRPPPGATPVSPAPEDITDVAPGPIELTTSTTIVGGPPPVRFTNRGTMISTTLSVSAAAAAAEHDKRMRQIREAFDTAASRDAVLAALAGALSILSSRIALLRVRNRELVGLTTMGTTLPDPAGRVVPIGVSGLLASVQSDARYVGFVDDAGFAQTFEIEMFTACLLRRIDVAGRPALVAYVDRAGQPFTATEPGILDEICTLAGRALELVVKQKRDQIDTTSVRGSSVAAPPAFGTASPAAAPPRTVTPVPVAESQSWRPPPALSSADLIVTDGPAPPRTRTIVDGSPAPVMRHVDDDRDGVRAPMEIDSLDAPASERITERYGGDEPPAPPASLDTPPESSRKGQFVTIHAMPPPPPLPPPPPMADDDSPLTMDTLMGLPPPVSGSDVRPRFVPPPLDDRDNSGIIPLSSPIDQPSMRGRIALDEEDWSQPGSSLPSESMQREVDTVLRQVAAGIADVGALQPHGDAALVRLAAQFPGPLEVLRRDLRALPPPSAHGPLIRAAIVIGADFVPHLVDLFDHPSADVRFYASFVFQELRDPRAMRPLAELAFDTSGDVRVIAMRVLETYARAPGFGEAIRVVRAQLDSTNRTRQLYAARAVGTLRDIESIAKLIDLLSNRDRFVQEAALESLCSITGQQLGLKPHRWKTWYAENEHRHRVEWIIESLRHRDVPVRRWAADELTRVTGHREPFSAMGDKRARDLAVEAWMNWWTQRGRAQLSRAT
jgi:hypothetical protein